MISFFKNLFGKSNKYASHPDAIIIACYFNPQRNKYRKKNFDIWYDSIKHLNHRIIECSIDGSEFELPYNDNFRRVSADTLLWHKETLLNKLIDEIIEEGYYEFIFWLDTDIIFENKNWLPGACQALQYREVVQPFEFCVHLEKDYTEPSFDQRNMLSTISKFGFDPKTFAKDKIWRSFCANATDPTSFYRTSTNYDEHGHVGFAWGATARCLRKIGGLFDSALIGGGDHIMAHAFANQMPCKCITNSFGNDVPEITEWSERASRYVAGSIGSIRGSVYHLWYGDTETRQYFKRVKEFTPLQKGSVVRDHNGMFITDDPIVKAYMNDYWMLRENVNMLDTINPDNLFVGTFDPTLDSQSDNPPAEFNGGQFGGGGAGADWVEGSSDNNAIDDNTSSYPTFS